MGVGFIIFFLRLQRFIEISRKNNNIGWYHDIYKKCFSLKSKKSVKEKILIEIKTQQRTN